MKTFESVDQYIASFPPETQALLQLMRITIQKAAPKSKETISYNMPAFRQDGILVYFAGYKKHIGFYPHGSGIAAFKNELSIYKGAKGSVQFPLDQKLPVKIISAIVKFRVKEDLQKTALKKKK